MWLVIWNSYNNFPMVPIRIFLYQGQGSPSFDALVDSGSDRNLFPMVLARSLGMDFLIYLNL